MTLKFYYDLMSQSCRALYIFLKMTSIPFEAKEIALRKLQHFTDEFVQINPMKKVPAIDHDGFRLSESAAIFAYLADRFDQNRFYPKDPQGRARVDEFNHWQHLNLRANGSMVFQSKVVLRLRSAENEEERRLV